MDSIMILGLVLCWSRSAGPLRELQVMFGHASTNISMWLRFGVRMVILALKDNDLAKVCMPTDSEIAEYAKAIGNKYPLLTKCWGAMDGLKLSMERPGDSDGYDIQAMFYNGWTCDHCLSNLFLFSPDGRIRHAYINCPGSMHDSTMAHNSGVYQKIDDIFDRIGYQVVVDSAFAAKNSDSLIKTIKDNMDSNGNIIMSLSKLNQAKAVRILSEWGMRGFQGSFPRLKSKIRYEERGERKILLQSLVLLFNFRSGTIGFNQIRTVFMPYLLNKKYY